MRDERESPIFQHAHALIGGLLRDKREERGLTIREVAGLVNRSRNWVWRTEVGARKLTMDEFLALSKLYRADPGELLQQAAEILQLPSEQ